MPPKIMTLICERSCDLSGQVDSKSQFNGMPGCYVVKFPCSGMIQPLMIEAALQNGADGVVVTGCQIGDCYFREGNKMIRERLLGDRPPGLKKDVDRRRVIGLWLSRLQTQKFISDTREFVAYVRGLEDAPAAAKPAPTPAAAKPAAAAKPSEAAQDKPAGSGEGSADK